MTITCIVILCKFPVDMIRHVHNTSICLLFIEFDGKYSLKDLNFFVFVNFSGTTLRYDDFSIILLKRFTKNIIFQIYLLFDLDRFISVSFGLVSTYASAVILTTETRKLNQTTTNSISYGTMSQPYSRPKVGEQILGKSGDCHDRIRI